MKTCNSKIKAPAFLGAALMLLIALLFTACPQRAKPKPKHTITFSVDGTGGTLKATAGGSAINSGNEVEEGKTVTFVATPAAGYKVKEWKLGGNAVNGTNTSYALAVTAAINVTVSFEPKKAFLTLAAGKNTVKVKAKTADGSAIKVEGCNVNELANEAETTLTVTNPERKLALIGDIIELDCSGDENVSGNRPLIALDVSGLTALQKLDCQYNKITALNVQGLTKLEKLNCSVNELTTLDVQGLTALQQLDCSVNQIPEFNVQGCAALQKLECGGNQLTTLNVQGCTVLQQLNCRSNKLTALNVQGCTALKELNCSRNQLTALDVSGLKALQELDCRSNQLATLNVQGLTALQKLDCESNQLSTLDVQGLTKLQKLDCRNNQLSALDVQGCTALKSLLCFRNKLNADVFTKLFNDLPTREASDGAKAILYTEPDVYNPQANDGNCTNFNTPESLKKAFEGAKAKHWKMQKAGVFGIPSDI